MAFECGYCGETFMIWKKFRYHRMLCFIDNGKNLEKK
jgi:hypothetical protein